MRNKSTAARLIKRKSEKCISGVVRSFSKLQDKFKLRCSQWQKDERSLDDIISEFGITLTTFFRWTKKYGIKKRAIK